MKDVIEVWEIVANDVENTDDGRGGDEYQLKLTRGECFFCRMSNSTVFGPVTLGQKYAVERIWRLWRTITSFGRSKAYFATMRAIELS